MKVKWATLKIEDQPDDQEDENLDLEKFKFIKDYFIICDNLERYILLYMLIKLKFITG